MEKQKKMTLREIAIQYFLAKDDEEACTMAAENPLSQIEKDAAIQLMIKPRAVSSHIESTGGGGESSNTQKALQDSPIRRPRK